MGLSHKTTDRFWAKVRMSLFCWEWTGTHDDLGYGMFRVPRGAPPVQRAHRVSWELRFGPIPPGLIVMHSCDNPSCVNPAHLSLGSHADNNADMVSKGRANHPVGHIGVGRKLNEQAVRSIRARVEGGETKRSLAREFGVHASVISRVCSGKEWGHVSLVPDQSRAGGE